MDIGRVYHSLRRCIGFLPSREMRRLLTAGSLSSACRSRGSLLLASLKQQQQQQQRTKSQIIHNVGLQRDERAAYHNDA